MKPHTVLIVDDHEIVRAGLKAVFGFAEDFSVVGEASDGAEAVQEAIRLSPDVIVMDLVMPDMNGADATREIMSALPSSHVIILTTYATSAEVMKAVEAGAAGAFSKDTPNDILMESIRRVLAGEQLFSDDIRKLVLSDKKATGLTSRQQDILRNLAKGLSNKEIAGLYDISEDGVKSHLRAIYAKLGAVNRSEAVAIALRQQLLKI